MNHLESFLNISNIITIDQVNWIASTLEGYASPVLNESIAFIGYIFDFIFINLCSPIEFTELQITLLTVFLIIISVNIALIAYFWNKYGGVITDRFIRPSTLIEIEELKQSVAKLKLPNEHTPRI